MSVQRSLQFMLAQTSGWLMEHPDTVRSALKLGAEAACENEALRREVNALRAKLGMGRKCVKWNENKPMGECPIESRRIEEEI